MSLGKYRNLIIGVVIGLVLGILLGMLLFWQLFPVKWTDAHSYDLSPEDRADYISLVADSFKLEMGDPTRAKALLQLWSDEEKQQAVTDALGKYEREARPDKVQALRDLSMALGLSQPVEAIPTPVPVEPPSTGIWDRLRIPCLVFVLVLLALVLAAYGWRMLRQRGGASQLLPQPTPSQETMPVSRGHGGEWLPGDVGPFVATYQRGEDVYDDSFPIETPDGEFLGECGMGLPEGVGIGPTDMVTAIEVWLFDKSDIRTVTKVLMSDYAFGDDILRAELAPKGEPVLAEMGRPVILETSGLQVRVDIAELTYGEGELPPRSFFDRLTVEMIATPKQTHASVSS